MILFVLVCLSADWAGALVPINSFLFVVEFLLASFLRGCLVGLLSLGCSPFSVSFPGGVLGPVSFGLLFASACSVCPCVSGVVWSVRVLCGVFVVLRGRVGLWLLLFFPPRLLCSSLLLWCGVASVWPALSWLRSPPDLPAPLVGPLVPSGPVVFCWSLPPGIWLYLRRPGCHACGMVCCACLAPVFTSPHGNKGFGPVGLCPLHHVAGVV